MSEELLQALVRCGSLQFGRFTLASGKASDYYVDKMLAITDPPTLHLIARLMAPHVREADRLAGVELGAVPIAAAVALETGKPYVVVRKEPKAHGTGRAYEGVLRKGDVVAFVEDVVTTAGTLRTAVERLRSEGATVRRAIAIVDREEGGREALASIGVELVALVTARQLLDTHRKSVK